MPQKTDSRTLPVPSDLRLPDRQAEVVELKIYVSANWWQDHLDSRGLPGGPLQVQHDERGTFLTRADVWAHATDVQRDEIG